MRHGIAMQSGSCSLAVSSMAYAGVATPPLPLDAGPALVPAAIRHAGQYANNVHLVSPIEMAMPFAFTICRACTHLLRGDLPL